MVFHCRKKVLFLQEKSLSFHCRKQVVFLQDKEHWLSLQEAGPLALDKEILDDFLPFSRGRSSLMKNTGIVESRAKHPIARVFLTGVSINLYNMYNNSNEFVKGSNSNFHYYFKKYTAIGHCMDIRYFKHAD